MEVSATGTSGSDTADTTFRSGRMALVAVPPVGDSNVEVSGKIGARFARTSFTDSAGADETEHQERSSWGPGLQDGFKRMVSGRLWQAALPGRGRCHPGGRNWRNQYPMGEGLPALTGARVSEGRRCVRRAFPG